MKNIYQTIRAKFTQAQAWLLVTMTTVLNPVVALADGDEAQQAQQQLDKGATGIGNLPVHKEAYDAFNTGTSKGDWIGIVKGYIGEGGLLIALGISILGFLWVSYAALAKFNECRLGRAEWSELGVLVIAAAAMLVFITLLLTISKTIVGTEFKSLTE